MVILFLLQIQIANQLFDIILSVLIRPFLYKFKALSQCLQYGTDNAIIVVSLLLLVEVSGVFCELVLRLLQVLICEMKEVLERYFENTISIFFESGFEVFLA